MKTIKNKIQKIIKESNGFPHYTQDEYIEAIRLLLNKELIYKEIHFIQSQNVNLNKLIMKISDEITDDFL